MTNAAATVVFDLDGTLIETAPDLIDTLSLTLAQEGVPPVEYSQARDLIGAGARALVQRGLDIAKHEVSAARMDELFAFFLENYASRIAEKSRPYPGCEAALERLAARGAKLAVCTNKIERLAVQLLDELDMTRRFSAIVGGDTYPVAKPDAEPLLGAIERCGGLASRAVMVGDSSTDVGAARAAGVPVVVATFGYTLIPPKDLGGDALMDHYDQLEAEIDRLLPGALSA